MYVPESVLLVAIALLALAGWLIGLLFRRLFREAAKAASNMEMMAQMLMRHTQLANSTKPVIELLCTEVDRLKAELGTMKREAKRDHIRDQIRRHEKN